MPRHTKILRKEAAGLMLEGFILHEIAEILSVRPSTVLRWYKSRQFIAQVEALKHAKRLDMEVQLMRVTERAVLALDHQMYGPKDTCGIVNALKNIDRLRIFTDETGQNRPKPVQTGTKLVQTGTQPEQTGGICPP